MIKLIVSDMDGSLLDGEHRLPPDFPEVFSKLQKRGIPFVVASGRSFVSLKSYLSQMPGAPGCICNNGAYVMEHGKVSAVHPLSKDCIQRLLAACKEMPHLQVVLCGVHGTYLRDDGSEFAKAMCSFYDNYQTTDSLESVEDEIFTLGVNDIKGPSTHALPFLTERMGDAVSIRISGPTWMDITNRGVTKGAALAELQQRLGVTPEETMTFGDNYNDIEMLTNARYSFVMENAVHDMRQYGNYLAKSNLEHGVTDAIQRYVLSEQAPVS